MKSIVNPLCPVWTGAADLLLQKLLKERQGRRIAVITDDVVMVHCLPILRPVLEIFDIPVWQVPSGEQNKQLRICEQLWEQMAREQMDRKSTIIALGGGMITDLAGFVAGSYMRGIELISVPTSLLAQVDAALGGKTGVDLGSLKNYIGLIRQPAHIILDTRFLETLPDRQRINGLAEVVKHAIISGNGEWDRWKMTPSLLEIDWNEVVQGSASIKLGIVSGDVDEKGQRKVLNLGHSIGHAIESVALEKGSDVLHGEAVAAGIWCEAWISHQKGLLPQAEWDSISGLLRHYFPKVCLGHPDLDRFRYALVRDKKNSRGSILITGVSAPGEVFTDLEIDVSIAEQSLAAYGRYWECGAGPQLPD